MAMPVLGVATFSKLINFHMAMDQYLLIPFLMGWTFIYQLFWCLPGVQGFDTLPYVFFGDFEVFASKAQGCWKWWNLSPVSEGLEIDRHILHISLVQLLHITFLTLVGGLEHFLFSHILGMSSSPTDFHIFQRGRSTTNQNIWHVSEFTSPRSAAISCLIPLPYHAKPGTWLQGCRTCPYRPDLSIIWRFLTANWKQQKDPVDPRHDFGGDGGSGPTPRAQEVWKLRLGQLGC